MFRPTPPVTRGEKVVSCKWGPAEEKREEKMAWLRKAGETRVVSHSMTALVSFKESWKALKEGNIVSFFIMRKTTLASLTIITEGRKRDAERPGEATSIT